jgi:hypothetical protein
LGGAEATAFANRVRGASGSFPEGKKNLYWYTRLGQIEVSEQIYRRGGEQVRPFCESAGVSCRGYSLGLQRALSDFGADLAFGKVPQKLKEHYGIAVPVSAAQAITEQHAAAMKRQQAELQRLPRGGVAQLIGELDGSMVPIVSIAEREDKPAPVDGRQRRQLSWREARLSLARAPDKVRGRYAATLGGPAEAGAQLVDCVIRAGGGRATKLHCVGDGAKWIASQIKERLGEQANYLIDFYHLSEYLAGAAEAVAGSNKTAWLQQQQQRMKTNRVGEVLRELRAYQAPVQATTAAETDPVQSCRQYLEHRLGYLDYAGALSRGLPIGSGEVESGHRSVIQARLKLSGAWWKEETAENMLALRTLRANDDWEPYWSEARQAAA